MASNYGHRFAPEIISYAVWVVPSAKDLKPITEYLPAHLPQRIFPPGTTLAYSNYATTLAGYIVERTSGKPFNDYVSEFVFKSEHQTDENSEPKRWELETRTHISANLLVNYRVGLFVRLPEQNERPTR